MKRLAAALEVARTRRSRIGKEEAIGEALAAAAREGGVELATAARIASGRALPVGDGRALGVGWALMLDVVRNATGLDDEVIVACVRTTGDVGEAFGLLASGIEHAGRRPGLGLADVARLIDALAAEPSRAGKRALLDAAFARTTPLETKYLCKALGGGLRIGAQEGVAEGAIARAFGATVESVRAAAALVTDVGELAGLAHRGQLDLARLEVGRPVAFMLATPIEILATAIDPAGYAVEDKVDGVRAQAHRGPDGAVAVFARGLDRVTDAFPEIAEALAGAAAGTVFDGEIVALAPTGRPRPFQALQPRLKKTRATAADRQETPVTLVVFDLLADDSGPLLGRPWQERRGRLEGAIDGLATAGAIGINPVTRLAAHEPLDRALDQAFSAARARGHEGLVLKRVDAPYDAGRRGQAWIKVKRAQATLDVVIIAAEEGHGRRSGALSDYTFAVWHRDELVPVGKAYSGLSDDEIDAMTRRLEGLTLERRSGLRVVRPEVVLEVAFDGIQRSARHASGFALRFPRIVRIRQDKRPDDADHIAAVEAIFAAQIASGHREHGTGERARERKKVAAAAKRQLSLFGEDDS